MSYVIDIETAPNLVTEIMDFEPNYKLGNVKDPAKVQAAIIEKRASFIEDATLNATTCYIKAIGYYDGTEPTMDVAETPADEYELLKKFWERYYRAYDKTEHPRIINICLKRFDMPMIIRRCWKLGILMPVVTGFNGRFNSNFIDLSEIWAFGMPQEYISLDHLARHFGVGKKDKTCELFYREWIRDKARAIAYLHNDVVLAWKVAQAMGVVD